MWNDVTDFDIPIRFQIPRGYCEYGKNSQYNLIRLKFENTQFLDWFKNLESKLLDGLNPVDSRVKDNTIHLKYVEGFTQVFDKDDNFLFEGVTMNNCDLDCLVEIDKIYGPMKDTGSYGITCKIFQVRVLPRKEECLF